MSTANQSNAQVVAAYLDAVIRKDTDATDRFFDPNVEYMVNGTLEPDPAGVLPPISADCHAALPWLGLHRGRDAVRVFLAHMHRNLEVTAFGPREIISQGNRGQRLDGSDFTVFLRAGQPTSPTPSFLSSATGSSSSIASSKTPSM